jgi:hypothetical protein
VTKKSEDPKWLTEGRKDLKKFNEDVKKGTPKQDAAKKISDSKKKDK